MSNDKPAYGPYSASESILEFALRHPYEYVEQLRASQGDACSCCPRGETPDTAISSIRPSVDAPIAPSVAVQKGAEPDYLALSLDHMAHYETCMCPSCFLNRAYTRAT
jgi:hypothetical protein